MAYDVIVVGAGPAGSVAAKRCVEQGLRTLLVEKRRLPRNKVCSGMIMGPVAHSLIKQEFGDLPETVLTSPTHLSGYFFHIPGMGREKLDNYTPLTWRRNLDYWMNQKAQGSGAEIWQGARVTGIKERGKGFSVTITKENREQELESSFVIGADGGTSVTRKHLFPKLKVRYGQVYQEHYRGKLDLDNNYIHWFYPLEHSPESFTIHQKDGFIVLDVGCRPGQTKQLMAWARRYLAENHGFDVRQEPVWRGGCLQPAVYRELVSRTFEPARGNALLVGDAAGLTMPVSGEGIGTAIKSGLLAANSIQRAIESGELAEVVYLSEINSIISMIGEIYPWFKRITEEVRSGGRSLLRVLLDAYLRTLITF